MKLLLATQHVIHINEKIADIAGDVRRSSRVQVLLKVLVELSM